MHRSSKRLLALLLALLLCLSLFPAAALAEEPAGADAPADPSDDTDAPIGADAPGGPEEDPSASPDGSAQDDTGDDPDALPEEPLTDDLQDATASGDCGDNLTWTLENNVLTISGTGDMWNWSYPSPAPWSSSDSVKTVVIQPGVTSIGNFAFYNCSSLTSVTIPTGVTRIGNWAFGGCTSLTSVDIPESVIGIGNSAFDNCLSLTSVTIPEGVTSIGDDAFGGCSSLTSLTIPASLTSIGYAAFRGAPLADIWYRSTQAAWNQLSMVYDHCSVTVHCNDGDYGPFDTNYCGADLIWALAGSDVLTIAGSGYMWNFDYDAPWYRDRLLSEIQTVRILSGVTSIGDYAFVQCDHLTSVTIPSSVTRIGEYAFGWCSSLTSVTIPEGMTSIGNSAFMGCSSLASVTIPEGVTSIGNSAFRGCSSLASVTIPEGVTSIGNTAFAGCSNLTEIRFEGAAPAFGEYVFGTPYDSPVTATAYYPANDPTWTEEVRQDYGGNITWVAYEVEPTHTPGDTNGDGKVNLSDVVRLAQYVKARGVGVVIY